MKPHAFHRTTSLLLLAAASLTLSACVSPQGANSMARQKQIDSALEKAAMDSKTGSKQSFAVLETLYKRKSDDPEAAYNYAQSLRENGRAQRAAIVLGPFVQDGKSQNAAIVAEYGAIQAAMGSYTEAGQYARKAIALNPKFGQAYHVLGISLDAQGQHEEAEQAFRSALENWQGDPTPVLNNLGLNLAAQGFLDEAVETLRKAVALSPDRTEIERNLRIVSALQAQSPSHGRPVPVPPRKPAQG